MKRKFRNQTAEERREKARLHMSDLRRNLEYRQHEQEIDTARRRLHRSHEEVRQLEQEVDTARRRLRRSNEDVRKEEQEVNTIRRRLRRTHEEVRQHEQEIDTARRRLRRSHEDVRQKEQEVNTTRRRLRRTDENIRQEEQEVNTARRRLRRTDENVRQEEQEVNTARRRLRRTDENVRQEEQEVNTARRRLRRTDENIRQEEQEVNTARRRLRRTDENVRQEEQEVNTARRRLRRTEENVRQEEQKVNTARRRLRRTDENVRQLERIANTSRRNENRHKLNDFSTLASVYNHNITDGPIHVCSCCERLFFQTSMTIVKRQRLLKKGCTEDFIAEVILDEFLGEEKFSLCSSCNQNIIKQKYPKFCIKNSWLQFPDIPDVLKDIQPLEERCISPRIIFMKIYALSFEGQFGIRGGVVNVPVDVPKMFSSIPIRPEQTGTIQLKLKRKMSYKHHYKYEVIRPQNIWNAATYLVGTPLYKDEENITLDETWNNQNITTFNVNPSEIDEDAATTEISNVEDDIPTSDDTAADDINFPDDGPEETNEETMLDQCQGVEFAPGEGEIPLSILLDKYCEELAFPTIYCGVARHTNPAVKLSYEDIVNSELKRRDRRAVRPDHLLFVHKKTQCKQVSSSINIALKKTQAYGMTASQALSKSYLDKAISKDSAYRLLVNITGSPAYWEQQKKNVLAMLSQLGIFTFFITLSAAETHWPELLKILKKTVDNEDDADVSDLEYLEKNRLIRSDPVTCALYFDHRFKELQKTWNNVTDGPFGNAKVTYKYHRIEFQHRGSPHVHMVVWLENAPVYDPKGDESSEDAVTSFVDNIVTTSSECQLIDDVETFQFHRCTFTCKKFSKGKAVCRFNAPFAPMDKTRILKPIPKEFSMTKEKAKELRDLNQNISKLLSGDNYKTVGSFEDMLAKLGCDMDSYLLAFSSQLSAAKIFLKRHPKDCRINSYSPKILSLMRSNMDIQFVLDPYGCIGYIVDYINKSNRGLSKLLRQCVTDFKNGNYSNRQKYKAVANTFYNGTEVSAQEAAWCRLRLAMSHSSVQTEFINTLPKKDRQRILKSEYELSQLDPDSEDIAKTGPIDRYAERPNELEDLCLAEFVSDYTFHGKGIRIVDESKETQADLDADANDDEEHIVTKWKMLNGNGFLMKRRQRKVIKFCRFDVHKDPENFFRELVMLFKPWRNETTEVEEVNCEDIYIQHKEAIEAKYKLYTKVDIDFNEILAELEEQRDFELQYVEENPEAEIDASMMCYDLNDKGYQPNIMIDIGEEGAGTTDGIKTFTVPDQLHDEDYFNLCNSLNMKQRDYLMHHTSEAKKGKPFYHFISGAAGVGKSLLIKAIYQTNLRIFRYTPGPIEMGEVVLIAPTGKAAHNIGGMTAHAAFALAFNQESKNNLTAETLNTLQVKLFNMKLLIVDEVSMMGSNMFHSVHCRMCQIFKSNKPFGGKSVVVVGDFNQLRPVGDSYTFTPRKDPLAQLVGNYLWQNFQLFELNQIMRQKDDLIYAEALGRLARGELTQVDIVMFQSRCFRSHDELPDEAKKAVHIFWTKVEVDNYNKKRMKELASPTAKTITFKAVDKVVGPPNKRDAQLALNKTATLPTEKTYGLPASLTFQIGVRYMMTVNIDIADGLFNGASGVLRFVEITTKGPQAVWIEFDDPSVGKSCRADRKNIAEMLQLSPDVTPIFRTKKVFKPRKSGKSQILREQYPLVVAEGVTIHKSQGSTMVRVVVGLSEGMERSLLYVALSRATSLSGLFMIGNFKAPSRPPPNQPAVAEMNRLRLFSNLVPKFQWMRENQDNIQIISHNVQSLRKHLSSIICDSVYTKSHLLLFQETWLLEHEFVDVPGFIEVQRNNFTGRPVANGTIIFCKYSMRFQGGRSFEKSNGVGQHIEITTCFIDDIKIVNIYKNPKSTNEFLRTTLLGIDDLFDCDNILFCGDFNIDFSKPNEIENYLLHEFGLHMYSPKVPTTNEHATIDAVFGKLNSYNIHVSVYETIFSYHKPLMMRLYKK